MTFRSFYGSTPGEALAAARRELGPEAVVLAAREATRPASGQARFEVICGILPGEMAVGIPAAPQEDDGTDELNREPAGEGESVLSQFRRRVRTFRLNEPSGAANSGETVELRAALLADGFSRELTSDVLSGVRQRLRSQRSGAGGTVLTPQQALTDEFRDRLCVEAVLGRGQTTRRVAALVGPPGAGKTSLVVKLAVRCGIQERVPVRLISMDTERVGGTESLHTYAAAMGIPLQVTGPGVSLAGAIDAAPQTSLVLIDTPGFSPADAPAAEALGRVLSQHIEIDVHLVLPATYSAADMRAAYRRFRNFLPAKIAFTQTDNAASCRPAVGFALDVEAPVSFAGTGPVLPDDIREATVDTLLEASVVQRGAVTAA